MTHKSFLNFPRIIRTNTNSIVYTNVADVPITIEEWSNVHPFNAILFSVFPANRMGSNSDIILNSFGCPSKGHIAPRKKKL